MKALFRHLYAWVAVAIIVGVAVGQFAPEVGASLKPLADGFVALVKMLIAPVVFCTVALGVSGAGSLKKAGRVGLKAFVYFEAVSTAALAIGMLVGNVLKPGAGFGADPASLDASAVSGFAQKATDASASKFLLGLIPRTFFDAFTGEGNLMQTLLASALFGWAMASIGARAQPVRAIIEAAGHAFFAMIGAVMKLAPIGAGAAMAFAVGRYGIRSIGPLAYLMLCFYGACAAFVLLGLGAVARLCGFRLLAFLRYVRRELLLVLGTSSSESALAPLMQKLERLGCSKPTVGLVVPAGYSFNLDGTNIYLSLAALFVSQALGIDLSLRDQLTIFAVAMLTSKGASGVTGAGFVTLAATLAAVPKIPVEGLALIVGVDRFMSEARALTNVIGNGVAALAVARWEGELNLAALNAELARDPDR